MQSKKYMYSKTEKYILKKIRNLKLLSIKYLYTKSPLRLFNYSAVFPFEFENEIFIKIAELLMHF